MVGRPRQVDDSALLQSTVTVMGRTGPAAFTLALVAAEAGVVPATLVQRFKNKRGLIVALSRAHADHAAERHARAARHSLHPLDALADLVVNDWDPAITPQVFANHLAFFCADLVDEELRSITLATQQARDLAVRALLDSAVAAGTLAPGTNTAELTDTLRSAVAGAGLLWAMDHQGTLATRLRGALELALSPHRPPQISAATTVSAPAKDTPHPKDSP